MTNGANFKCGGCGRSHRWSVELAGRKARCPCGQVMSVPVSVEADELYDILEAPAAPARVGAGAVAAPRPAPVQPLDYRKPQTGVDPDADTYFPDRIKDLYFPLILIAGGTIVQFGFALIFSRGAGEWAAALGDLSLRFVSGTAVMLVAILIAGRLRRIDFGRWTVAVLKLGAVAIGAPAISLLAAPLFLLIPFVGGLVHAIAQFAIFFALLGALFDLDQEDTWYCVFVMFIVWIVLMFALG